MEAQGNGPFDKKGWRNRMTALRDTLDSDERRRNSALACRMVEDGILAPLRRRSDRPLTICLYGAFRSEADPELLFELALRAGDRIVAPRMVSSDSGRSLELREVRSMASFISGKWGVPEPDPARTTRYPESAPLDVVLVPGLAFDRFGGRLGYGGGFYDRLYAAETTGLREGTRWIGFAYSLQVTEERLPKESHDLRMDALATEKDVYWNSTWTEGL
ncbi:5-formyltetrahydrofolate cyclo-ligase [Cohnella faecalis]|uniref:5-formyltetrahydrofolate cyclo-ligase n=1 Tax=Cohnella faecalis TaxID=2315694 RepID=A0A398CM73_9BACL|nr:5-formyltetrahydrofolate cyclo-ligase [Cohnella faecalis]RIE00967.1 5-formyltetrahydrofolate cyclo-ligase [Cohnella faecalis]